MPYYIGEFSVVCWAPEGSGEQYLRDVMELFEQRGWSWSYHAFREFQAGASNMTESTGCRGCRSRCRPETPNAAGSSANSEKEPVNRQQPGILTPVPGGLRIKGPGLRRHRDSWRHAARSVMGPRGDISSPQSLAAYSRERFTRRPAAPNREITVFSPEKVEKIRFPGIIL